MHFFQQLLNTDIIGGTENHEFFFFFDEKNGTQLISHELKFYENITVIISNL